jgi:hypothetical protein
MVLVAAMAAGTITGIAAPAGADETLGAYAPPGTLLRAEPVTDLDPALVAIGAHEWRIWYAERSGVGNRPVVVSGMVIEPAGSPPPGGWRVVAWAHGTTGVAQPCAPSYTSNLAGQLAWVLPLLDKGYLVTATDYEGLGTPEPHPYLQPLGEGRAVIDSVRAARALVPRTSRTWLAFGMSQGGQATWAADELSSTWGFGLHLLGAMAAAPAADVSGMADEVPNGLSYWQKGLWPLLLYGLKQQHPQLNWADYLEGPALTEVPQIGAGCVAQAFYQDLPAADFTPISAQALAQAKRWLAENALPWWHAPAPMFVTVGTEDNVINPPWVDSAVQRACQLGDRLQYTYLQGVAHPGWPQVEAPAVAWILDRFARKPAPDNCATGPNQSASPNSFR